MVQNLKFNYRLSLITKFNSIIKDKTNGFASEFGNRFGPFCFKNDIEVFVHDFLDRFGIGRRVVDPMRTTFQAENEILLQILHFI